MSDDVLLVSPRSRVSELLDRPSWRLLVFVAGSVIAGPLAGLLWSALAPRSTYRIRDDLYASITERGHAQVVASDVVFTIITGLLGVVIGVVGWALLHRRGWLVTFVPPLAALAASLMAWQLGISIGDGNFVEEIAAAIPGDVVSVNLTLRSMSAMIVGPLAAVTPVMLLAAFWPEPRGDRSDEPRGAEQ